MKKKKGFNVAGVSFENDKGWKRGGDTMKRIDIIQNYVGHGTKFRAVRVLDFAGDLNAIRIDVIFKTGRLVDIGYVPNPKLKGRRLADELAPQIDAGCHLDLSFGRKHVDEKTGKVWGLALRYQVVTPEDMAKTNYPNADLT